MVYYGRLGHLELVALTAHGFDQYGQMQLAAAGYLERLGGLGVLDAQRYVGLHLLEQTRAQMAAGYELAFTTGHRRIVDREGHRHGRVFDLDKRQRLSVIHIAQRVADGNIIEAAYGHYIAHLGLSAVDALQTIELEQTSQTSGNAYGSLIVMATHGHLTGLYGAALYAADTYTANVFVIVDRRHQHLERRFGIALRRRYVLQYAVKQRLHIGTGLMPVQRGGAVAAGGEYNRAVELLVVCVQLQQQHTRLIHNLVRTCVGTVDLVDNYDYRQAQLQRLFKHEAGLRHRAFKRIDQQQHAAHHLQYALYLARKVGVAGSIDYVDFDALIVYGGILRQYGYTAFALKVVRVHDAFGNLLIVAEHARLLEHLVHQCGLTMVNVGNDGYITQIVAGNYQCKDPFHMLHGN